MPLLRARMERPDGSCVVPGVRASLGQLDECWGDGGANQSVADPDGYGTAEKSARTDAWEEFAILLLVEPGTLYVKEAKAGKSGQGERAPCRSSLQ